MKKDKLMIELCRNIMLVPEEVQFDALRRFVKACRWVYSIGFFHWRFNNQDIIEHNIPNNNKQEDLIELIGKYLQKIQWITVNQKKVKVENVKNMIDEDFIQEYDFEHEFK